MEPPPSSQENLCNKRSKSFISKKTVLIVSSIAVLIMIGLIITIALLATTFAAPKCSKVVDKSCDKPECFMFASEIVKGINFSINPCVDFFEYTCGNMKKFDYVIEDDALQQNEFLKVNSYILSRLRDLLEKDGQEENINSPLEKGRKMYRACMDESQTEQNFKALSDAIKKVGGWPVVVGNTWEEQNQIRGFEDLAHFYSELFRVRPDGILFAFSVIPDYRQNTQQIATFFQPKVLFDLIPPDKQNTVITAIMNAVKKFNTSAVDEAFIKRDSEGIVKVNNEIRLITNKYRNPSAFTMYNKTTVGFFSNIIPNINWIAFLNGIFQNKKKWTENDEILVIGLRYFEEISQKLTDKVFSVRDLVNYEILKLVQEAFTHFDAEGQSQTSNFISLLNTESELSTYQRAKQPRWKFCVNTVNQWLKFALAKIYADLYIDMKTTKEEARDITKHIIEVFRKELNELPWLDSETRTNAQQKLQNLRQYYLYPKWSFVIDNLTDYYKDLPTHSVHVNNMLSFKRFTMEKILNSLALSDGNRETFTEIVPLDVNSFYRANENAMYILLGMTQTPIFHVDRLRVMNFATLGSIIGHEITHGYDSNGQQYDENGNIKNWFTNNARIVFDQKKQCFINQYSKYSLTSEDVPGINQTMVNGMVTLNENIADNGGIRQAYMGYKHWISKHGYERLPDALRRFSLEQVFFLSYAHSMCLKYSQVNDDLSKIIKNDKHSPSKFRVIGTLSNFEAFSTAFKCKPGDPMVRDANEQCRIW